jgi:cation diffusion facilitator CzcD-associated flavoprotein CzcO
VPKGVDEVPVLIVGAGAGRLATAAFLAKYGVESLVVEKPESRRVADSPTKHRPRIGDGFRALRKRVKLRAFSRSPDTWSLPASQQRTGDWRGGFRSPTRSRRIRDSSDVNGRRWRTT